MLIKSLFECNQVCCFVLLAEVPALLQVPLKNFALFVVAHWWRWIGRIIISCCNLKSLPLLWSIMICQSSRGKVDPPRFDLIINSCKWICSRGIITNNYIFINIIDLTVYKISQLCHLIDSIQQKINTSIISTAVRNTLELIHISLQGLPDTSSQYCIGVDIKQGKRQLKFYLPYYNIPPFVMMMLNYCWLGDHCVE